MTTTGSTDLRRYLGHLALFLLPVAILVVAEQVALHRGWLTFRVWEQLVILPATIHPAPPFPGPFYPRQTLTRSEQGDLGFHTPLAASRQVTWKTDRYGYRNEDTAIPPTVVVVGDSMIAGSSLDQSEILSTRLEQELGVPVVNLAPTSVRAFFSETRFFDHKPSAVLFGISERQLEQTRSCEGPPPSPSEHVGDGALDWLAAEWWVARDRQKKEPFRHWAESRLYNLRLTSFVGRDRRTLFHRGDSVHTTDPALIDQGTRNLASCGALLVANGIAYLPFIVPDKETIYWDLLPSHKKSGNYRRALDGLKAARLPLIDLDAAFSAERQRSPEPLYPRDESHWSPRAVSLTSRILAEALNRMGVLAPAPR
jgi:hypothetical protein